MNCEWIVLLCFFLLVAFALMTNTSIVRMKFILIHFSLLFFTQTLDSRSWPIVGRLQYSNDRHFNSFSFVCRIFTINSRDTCKSLHCHHHATKAIVILLKPLLCDFHIANTRTRNNVLSHCLFACYVVLRYRKSRRELWEKSFV